MAELREAILKLQMAGITGVPNPSQVSSMPGLSKEEKALIINAVNTGQFAAIVNQAMPASAAGSGYHGTSASAVGSHGTSGGGTFGAPSSQVAQKRDTSPVPSGGPAAAADWYSENRKEINPKSLGQAMKEKFDAQFPMSSYTPTQQAALNVVNSQGIPTGYTPGGGMTTSLPSIPKGAYTRDSVVANAPNIPGGSTYDSQVPQAAGGGPKYQYTPPHARTSGPSLTDILSGGGASGAITQPSISAPDIYTPGAPPAAPDYSSVHTPTGIDFTFKRNPFTKEGKKMAADVYAPQYETLDRLRNSANNQYSRSDKVIESMYAGLADDVLQSRKDRNKEYDAEVAATTDTGKAAAGAVAQGYDSGSKVMGDIMKNLLGSDRTNKVNPNSLQEMAQERGGAMADMTSDAQKAGQTLKTNKNTQNDYATNLGEAFQTQGAVSREDLLGQLNDVIGQYGNQELDLNSQERSSALALGSQLSDWDWTSQQANYQTLQDQQANAWNQANWDRSNISDAYSNKWNQYTAGEQGRQFGSGQEWDAYNQALQNQMAAAKAQQDAAAAAADAAAKSGAPADPLDPGKYGEGVSGAAASMYNYVNQFMPDAGFTGDDIQQGLSAAAGFLSPRIGTYTGMTGGQQKYIDDLLASQPNLSPAKKQLLRIAADQYWNIMLQTDRTVPKP